MRHTVLNNIDNVGIFRLISVNDCFPHALVFNPQGTGRGYRQGDRGGIRRNGIQDGCFGILVSEEGIEGAPQDVTAFGDDLADIGMLRMCGTGVAMGNALNEVKDAADITIGSNDEDGIADYLMSL